MPRLRAEVRVSYKDTVKGGQAEKKKCYEQARRRMRLFDTQIEMSIQIRTGTGPA